MIVYVCLEFTAGGVDRATLDSPRDVALGAEGRLYIATRRRVRLLDGGVVSTIAGSGAEAELDGPALSAQFRELEGLAVDRRGRVFVSDGGAGRIRVYEP